MAMTLPYRRQQGTPRLGGRVAGDRRAVMDREYGSGTARTVGSGGAVRTAGNTALAPQRDVRPNGAGRAATDRPTLPRLRVAPPAPVSAPRAPFVAMVLTVVVVGVLGILVLNTKINENAFRLQALHQQQGSLDLTEQQLAKDLAVAESPNSLAAAARRLGLVPAGTPAFIRLPDGRVLGVPQPASGQPSASGTPTATTNQAGENQPGTNQAGTNQPAGQPRG